MALFASVERLSIFFNNFFLLKFYTYGFYLFYYHENILTIMSVGINYGFLGEEKCVKLLKTNNFQSGIF